MVGFLGVWDPPVESANLLELAYLLFLRGSPGMVFDAAPFAAEQSIRR